MTYPRLALRGLATIRHERFRLIRAVSTSTLLFMPAVLIAICHQPASWIFPFTLSAAYSMMIVLLARRLSLPSLAGLPAMQWLGHAYAGHSWMMLPVLAVMLLLMAVAARRGLHKGMQFWVFCLLLSNMMPSQGLPAGLHALLALAGALYGLMLGHWGLRGWQRILPGASTADTRRYAWHLVLWGCLAWWQPAPAIHMLILCLSLATALMLMQRSFRWFIAGLTLLVLSAMPVTQVQHGVVERVADTLLVGVLLASLAWWLEMGAKQWHALAQDKAG